MSQVCFPLISFQRAGAYPITRTNTYKTKVLQFLNDQEQRWVAQRQMQDLELVFTAVDGYSVSVVREFWNSVHGADVTPWTLNLGNDAITGQPLTYTNLIFVGDDFKVTANQKPNRFDLTLKCRQAN